MNTQATIKHVQKPTVSVTRDQLINQICAQRGSRLTALRQVRNAK